MYKHEADEQKYPRQKRVWPAALVGMAAVYVAISPLFNTHAASNPNVAATPNSAPPLPNPFGCIAQNRSQWREPTQSEMQTLSLNPTYRQQLLFGRATCKRAVTVYDSVINQESSSVTGVGPVCLLVDLQDRHHDMRLTLQGAFEPDSKSHDVLAVCVNPHATLPALGAPEEKI